MAQKSSHTFFSLCTLRACWNHFFSLTRIPVLKFFILIKEKRSWDNREINWEIWQSLTFKLVDVTTMQIQIHKYTSTQVHKYTNTQIECGRWIGRSDRLLNSIWSMSRLPSFASRLPQIKTQAGFVSSFISYILRPQIFFSTPLSCPRKIWYPCW